jgi:transglutaminase-like putative cysteine protease
MVITIVRGIPMRHAAVRSIVLSFLIAPAALLLSWYPARAAETKKEFAGYTKYTSYRVHYDVNADGTHVETESWALKVLSEQGVSYANSGSVSFSDRLETVTDISAYTLKADGRKIDVPAGNYQDETNTGKGEASPMFSDIRTKTVAFPDVAVGDTVVMSYKRTQKEATFPGNFSMLQSFSKFQVYDDVQISLSAPTSVAMRVYSRGVEGGEAPSSDGRRNWAWTYKNQQVATPEAASVSSLDNGPLIVATTFKDYGALASAYNARAKVKSQPTDRIRKLANDLTANAKTPREQARALYEWVSQNIKFAGNCVGVGSVVPHDADLVLANRMGDCKDHTALLEAMLAVKGIASTPALINSGTAYTLPEVPCIDIFNHVISYIPSLDQYADSTSEYTPFGSLPMGDSGKPVVHTIDFKGIDHTPAVNWKDNGSHSTTIVNIHSDGSADGETEIDGKGEAAEGARYWMRYMQPNMEDSMMRRVLTGNGFTGTGVMVKGDLKSFTDSFKYGAKYKISDAMNLPGPGAMYLRSPFDGAGSVSKYVLSAEYPDPTLDFVCTGDFARQDLTIHLPKDVKVLAIPKNVEIKGKYQTYKATYQLKGDTVTAVREVEDHTPGPVCAPAVGVEYKKFAIGVKKDLRGQLLYQ